MKSLNENIFHQYNKWKKNYVRKENSIKIRLNDFLDRNPLYRDILSISEDGKRVNCNGSILLYNRMLINGKLPFPFGKINGYFSCCGCEELISLEGAPEEVEGSFNCSRCSNLTSLEGTPEKVGWDFSCIECSKLTSLKGAPKEVVRSFTCSRCPNLTSLEGAPEKVGGDFSCNKCYSLTTLEYLPKKIGGELEVDMRFKGKYH